MKTLYDESGRSLRLNEPSGVFSVSIHFRLTHVVGFALLNSELQSFKRSWNPNGLNPLVPIAQFGSSAKQGHTLFLRRSFSMDASTSFSKGRLPAIPLTEQNNLFEKTMNLIVGILTVCH